MLRTLDFRERTRLRRAIYAKPTILVVFLLTIVTLRGAWGMWEKSKEALANRDKALSEQGTLEVREKGLRDDITRLSTPRGQEEEIRNRFMVAKEGEKVIVITEPAQEVSHTVTVDENSTSGSFIDQLKAAVGISGN